MLRGAGCLEGCMCLAPGVREYIGERFARGSCEI